MDELTEARGMFDASAGMPFIVSSNAEKVGPATRRLIRSHARRGRSRKAARSDRENETSRAGSENQGERVKLDGIVQMYSSLIPRHVGSDLSFAELPNGIEPSLLLTLIKGW